ncbi:MAG: HAD family phosphatase [Bacteroidota bacterium]|nr:HAD family phosphatase [Bacteroidota bacterium]
MDTSKPVIQNIIFDLGGVMLDLDVYRTYRAFEAIGFNQEELINNKEHRKIFWQFEIGKLSPEEFCENIELALGRKVPSKTIENAWNAMILGFKPEKIKFLQEINSGYRTFLLSNTNYFHEKVYSRMLTDTFGLSMSDIFEKHYYSHLLGMGKPDPEIFEHVLKENALIAGETLFVDDSPQHIQSAQKLGIQCLHFPVNGDLEKVLKYLKKI